MIDNSIVRENQSRADLQAAFGPQLEFDRDLAPLTSYKTGGKARYFYDADSAEAVSFAVKTARQLKLDYFLIGGGSNLLISDKGFDGLIVKVDVHGLSVEGDQITCGAGENLMALVDFATENGLTGLEFAAGIWGSVGGAIYGNAGAFGGEIGSVVTGITLVDGAGEIREETPEYCTFGYRDSRLKRSHEIVVQARFKLAKGDKKKIQERIDEIIMHRNQRHPNDGKSAGCFFKNIPDATQPYGKLPAGKLLEEAGAKELQVGGAKVFENHANIIVNTGNATSADIRALANLMKERVRQKFGITLEEEVIQVGTF